MKCKKSLLHPMHPHLISIISVKEAAIHRIGILVFHILALF